MVAAKDYIVTADPKRWAGRGSPPVWYELIDDVRFWREADIEVYPKAYQLSATDRPLSRRMMYASCSLQNCLASDTNHAHPQINLFRVADDETVGRRWSISVLPRLAIHPPRRLQKDRAWQTSIGRSRKNSAFANNRSRRRWCCSTAAPLFRSLRDTARKLRMRSTMHNCVRWRSV